MTVLWFWLSVMFGILTDAALFSLWLWKRYIFRQPPWYVIEAQGYFGGLTKEVRLGSPAETIQP